MLLDLTFYLYSVCLIKDNVIWVSGLFVYLVNCFFAWFLPPLEQSWWQNQNLLSALLYQIEKPCNKRLGPSLPPPLTEKQEKESLGPKMSLQRMGGGEC